MRKRGIEGTITKKMYKYITGEVLKIEILCDKTGREYIARPKSKIAKKEFSFLKAGDKVFITGRIRLDGYTIYSPRIREIYKKEYVEAL